MAGFYFKDAVKQVSRNTSLHFRLHPSVICWGWSLSQRHTARCDVKWISLFPQSNTVLHEMLRGGSRHRVPLIPLKPAVTHLVVSAEVLVLLDDLQLLASPHQNCPHPTACQVGVQLWCKYIDSSRWQSLYTPTDRKVKFQPRYLCRGDWNF